MLKRLFKRYCKECKFFLNEDIYGHGYCELDNKERICSQLCEILPKYELNKKG